MAYKMGIERMVRNDRLDCKCIPKCPPLAKGPSVPSTRPPPSIVLCESSSASWGEGEGEKRVMTLPCPQPGGLPPGKALQPGEEVGSGLAAPLGPIGGSQAIAERQLGSTSPSWSRDSFWSSQRRFACLQKTAQEKTSGLGRLGSLAPPRPKSSQGQREPPRVLLLTLLFPVILRGILRSEEEEIKPSSRGELRTSLWSWVFSSSDTSRHSPGTPEVSRPCSQASGISVPLLTAAQEPQATRRRTSISIMGSLVYAKDLKSLPRRHYKIQIKKKKNQDGGKYRLQKIRVITTTMKNKNTQIFRQSESLAEAAEVCAEEHELLL